MDGFQPDVQFFLQKKQAIQQRHRIGTAGEGNGNGFSGLDHAIPADHCQQFILHVSTPGRRNAGTGAATGV